MAGPLRNSGMMTQLIRQIGRILVPKRYRRRIKRWILSLLGLLDGPDPQRFAAVYCGAGRVLAYHPKAQYMYVDGADVSITPRVISGSYERNVTLALESLVLPGFVVVEGGANQGFHTLSMASMVYPGGRVLAFEADPRNLAVLKDNIRSHYLDAVVTVIPKAACQENGPVSFFRARSGGQSSLFPLQADSGPCASCYSPPQEAQIEVEGVTIASVLAEHKLIPDLVRLDIEGAEPLALEGMWKYLENLPDIIVVFEYNPWCIRQGQLRTPEAFINSLRDIGMQFWRITVHGVLESCQPEEIIKTPDFVRVDDLVACRSARLLQRWRK